MNTTTPLPDVRTTSNPLAPAPTLEEQVAALEAEVAEIQKRIDEVEERKVTKPR